MSDDDGRTLSAHLVLHCVCAWCWGELAELFDVDTGRYVAICHTCGGAPTAYHHRAWKEKEIEQSRLDYAEVTAFYRRSPYAAEIGLTPPDTDRMARLRRVLRGDGLGID